MSQGFDGHICGITAKEMYEHVMRYQEYLLQYRNSFYFPVSVLELKWVAVC